MGRGRHAFSAKGLPQLESVELRRGRATAAAGEGEGARHSGLALGLVAAVVVGAAARGLKSHSAGLAGGAHALAAGAGEALPSTEEGLRLSRGEAAGRGGVEACSCSGAACERRREAVGCPPHEGVDSTPILMWDSL